MLIPVTHLVACSGALPSGKQLVHINPAFVSSMERVTISAHDTLAVIPLWVLSARETVTVVFMVNPSGPAHYLVSDEDAAILRGDL